MRHLLAARPSEFPRFDVPPEYELSEFEAEALLDGGVVELCELHSDDRRAVYHVAPEFAAHFGGESEVVWREVEERLCRVRSAEPPRARTASDVLVIGEEVRLRPLSESEAERLEEEGVIYADKNFGGRRRTLWHVDPAFAENLAPGEDVAEAIEAQLDTVPCRRHERTRGPARESAAR